MHSFQIDCLLLLCKLILPNIIGGFLRCNQISWSQLLLFLFNLSMELPSICSLSSPRISNIFSPTYENQRLPLVPVQVHQLSWCAPPTDLLGSWQARVGLCLGKVFRPTASIPISIHGELSNSYPLRICCTGPCQGPFVTPQWLHGKPSPWPLPAYLTGSKTVACAEAFLPALLPHQFLPAIEWSSSRRTR